MTGAVTLVGAALDALMPMHLTLDGAARIRGRGRAIARLAGAAAAPGRDLFSGFEVLRPEGIASPADLFAASDRLLVLSVRPGTRQVTLRGHLVGAAGGGGVLNLSLGLSDLPDLGGADLTAQDFAPTDPTVDMLYLQEAKALAFAETCQLVRRLHGDKTRAEEAARTDALTGLRNRRDLERILGETIRNGEAFALCTVDLDHFKAVNDTLGHAAGDAVLCAVARRLDGIVRASDTVARVGGDEFVLLFPGFVEDAVLRAMAERIVAELERPVEVAGRSCRISASIGITVSTAYDPPDPARMISDADRALYVSKMAGGARHSFHGAAA